MLATLQDRVQKVFEEQIILDEYHLGSEEIIACEYQIIVCGHCVNIYSK